MITFGPTKFSPYYKKYVFCNRVGLMMFGPCEEEVKDESQCHVWHHAKMMKLLVHKPAQSR